MRIALTGTPGTGKTAVSAVLRDRGYDVLDMSQYIRDNGLMDAYDAERDTYDVDVDLLNDHLSDRVGTIFEGHLSHLLDVDMAIVLRCSPSELYQRLTVRGYATSKVTENVQAEALDVILVEAIESGVPTYCVDTTHGDVGGVADGIEDVMKGNVIGHMPEDVSWAEEMDKWF